MTALAHISDIHFGAVDARAAASLAEHLNSDGVDGIIITGDITQSGRKKEFREAAAYLGSFDAPALVVPGNHDAPVYNLGRRFLDPWGRFRDHIHPDLMPSLEIADICIVGLNSARRASLKLDWSLGRLSRRQLAEATEKLLNSNAALKLVAFHHPVLPSPGRAGMALINQPARAIRAFTAAGADALLTGHAHTARAELHDAGERPIIVASAGTAASTRTRGEAPSYNLLSWTGSELSVAIHRFGGAGYEPDIVKTFRRRNDAWDSVSNP